MTLLSVFWLFLASESHSQVRYGSTVETGYILLTFHTLGGLSRETNSIIFSNPKEFLDILPNLVFMQYLQNTLCRFIYALIIIFI